MSQIVIENLFNFTIHAETSQSKVIDLIHENGIDWMHACGKKARCTTCKMIVVEGKENLTEMNDREKLFLSQGRLKPNERLSCQTALTGERIVIRVAERNKFPHLEYSK